MEIFFWSTLAFFSASVPWSLIIGFLVSKKDIRKIGDSNPGSTNALKAGGWKIGLIAILADIGKAFLPVYFSLIYGVNSWGLVIVSTSAISGSLFSPFLKFNGSKSLAVTLGVWLAISSGIIGPIICLMMAFSHLIQRVHIWTIILGFLGILLWILIFSLNIQLITLWSINFPLVMLLKHRSELKQKVIFRDWISSRGRA